MKKSSVEGIETFSSQGKIWGVREQLARKEGKAGKKQHEPKGKVMQKTGQLRGKISHGEMNSSSEHRMRQGTKVKEDEQQEKGRCAYHHYASTSLRPFDRGVRS